MWGLSQVSPVVPPLRETWANGKAPRNTLGIPCENRHIHLHTHIENRALAAEHYVTARTKRFLQIRGYERCKHPSIHPWNCWFCNPRESAPFRATKTVQISAISQTRPNIGAQRFPARTLRILAGPSFVPKVRGSAPGSHQSRSNFRHSADKAKYRRPRVPGPDFAVFGGAFFRPENLGIGPK